MYSDKKTSASSARSAPGHAGSLDGAAILVRAPAWASCEGTLLRMLGDTVRMQFARAAVSDPPDPSGYGSGITLTDVTRGVQLEICIFATRASAALVAATIFGDPAVCSDEDAVRDTMLELANTAMGALQVAFRGHGYEMTAGLPRYLDLARADLGPAPSPRSKAFSFQSGGVRLSFALTVRATRPRTMKARELRDGMILAAPVFSATQERLGAMGARISQAFIERLVALDADLDVELCEPIEG